jgi:hypothetical protein
MSSSRRVFRFNSLILEKMPVALIRFSAAKVLAGTTACRLFFPCNGGIEHSIGASHAAINSDCFCRAVHLACSAFHAGFRIDQQCCLVTWCEYGMGADCSAHPAIDALFRVVMERV